MKNVIIQELWFWRTQENKLDSIEGGGGDGDREVDGGGVGVGVPKKLDIAFHILFGCLIGFFGAKTINRKINLYVENPAGHFFFFLRNNIFHSSQNF